MSHSRVDLSAVSLSEAPVFVKKSRVHARRAKPGERLETVLKDGTVETVRVLEGAEWVVTNPGGEEYAMGEEKFSSRYRSTEDEGVFQAVGEVRAVPNPWSRPIVITAPWGEDQFGDGRCMIAEGDTGERYIIGCAEFRETYDLKS